MQQSRLLAMTDPERRTIEAYNAIAAVSPDPDPAYRLYADSETMELRHFMAENPYMLDLCCGYGRGVDLFAGLNIGIDRYIGVDASEGMIKIARASYPNLDFRVGNVFSLADVVGETRFDACFCITAFMHIAPENMPHAATSIRNVLRTGAILYIATPRDGEIRIADHSCRDYIPQGHEMLHVPWQDDALLRIFEPVGFQFLVSFTQAVGLTKVAMTAI